LHVADRIIEENQMTISTKSKPSLVSTLIADRQKCLNIDDAQLAMALGFERPNIIAMIKAGRSLLPANKVAAVAAALSIDPAHLLRTHLAETALEILAAVDALLTPQLLTSNEVKLLENYRQLSRGQDVAPVIMDGSNIIALIVA
jgi:hypothetical protein